MRIIIVGCGRVGSVIAGELQKENHEITVIDKNERILDEIGSSLDVNCYVGNGVLHEVLSNAGAEKCDMIIAVTSSDETNMLCCLVAGKLGVKYKIARIRDPEYVRQIKYFETGLGLSMVINPEKAVADEIVRILRFPSALHVERFANGAAEMVSIRIPSGNAIDGLPLKKAAQKLGHHVLVCAVNHDGKVSIPNGNTEISCGDILHIVGSPDAIENTCEAIGIQAHSISDVLITGGGNISYYLAGELHGKRMRTAIIEKNPELAKELARRLEGVEVLTGDAFEQDVLNESGIKYVDAFVALTGIDEGNLLSAIYAQSIGVGKVIAKVNNSSLLTLIKEYPPENTISPKQVTINQILGFVRSRIQDSGSQILSLYKFAGGIAEASEFVANGEIEGLTGVEFKSLKSRDGVLICCIVRNNGVIIPHGSDMILPGDRVIVATAGHILTKLSDILE